VSGSINIPVVSKFDPTGIKQAESALGGFKSSLGRIGVAIGAAFSVAAIGNFVKASVTAASNLEESLNAVAVSYGAASASVAKLGEDAASRLGVTQSAFNQAAVRFSAFAEKVVGEGGDVTGFVDDITTRAADFASVFNIDVSEALQVFQSGLAGEAEPLKRFGINLLQSEVQAYALREGLIAVGEQMTEDQKMVARYGLLMESTAKTAGDFANTSDGLANSQRILTATFQDMQATVGSALLPVLASLAQSLIPIVEELAPMLSEVFEELQPTITELAGTIPTLLRAFMPLLPVIGQLAALFADVLIAVMPVFVKLMESLIPIVMMVVDALLPIIEMALPIFVRLLELAMAILLPIIEGVLPIFITLFEILAPVILEVIEALLPLIEELLPLFMLGIELMLPVLQLFADMLAVALPAAFDLFQSLGLVPSLEATETWAEGLGQVVGGIRLFFVNAMNSIITALNTAANSFIRSINTILEQGRKLPGALGAIYRGIGNLQEIPLNLIGLYDGMMFPEVDTTGISDLFDRPSRRPGTGTSTSSDSFISGTTPQRGFYTDQMGRQIFGNIPAMAKGGIVMGPTTALIGEAGPEAVIPLSRLGGGGSTYNITINANVADARLGEIVVNSIKRYERNSGPVFAKA
jgi:phage-related protein